MGNKKNSDLPEDIHNGRREKLRNRFVREGLVSFSESELLEFALSFAVPRVDTNPTAHRLLNKFGDLENVLNATPTMLENVAGVGDNTAVFLSFLKHLMTYTASMRLKRTKIKSIKDAIDYLRPLMKTYAVEEFVLICLCKNGTVLLVETFTSNDMGKVRLNMRELLEMLIRVKTSGAIVAHNHLDSDPTPSDADIFLTRQLAQGCIALGIEPIDHLIFAGDNYYSFAEKGLVNAFKNEYVKMLSIPMPIERFNRILSD
jgi:DNA repair protein RadC